MSFLIRITGPVENDEPDVVPQGSTNLEEMKMEELIRQIFDEEKITHDTWQYSRDGKSFMVEFPIIGRVFAEKVLDRLSYYNVGKTEDSNIMVIEPVAIVCRRPKTNGPHDIPLKHFQKFVNSLKSRLTVAQVYHAISNQGNFNFNYLCFLICAAIVADIALVTDSAACVFASMLLSPVMEPIMCIIFGLSLREKRMTMKGFRNTTVSLVICIVVGLSFGIPAHFISMFQSIAPYPTGQMSSRGEAKALIGSVIVAAASGVSVSFAILSNSLAAMIGNAISLSLLPPAVNCGQLFLLAVIALIDRPYVMKKIEPVSINSTVGVAVVQCQYSWIEKYEFIYANNACDAPTEFAILGVVSFCLTLLNIVLIIITGYSVNRLKDLVPMSFTNDETRRFYTKDLKEVRENYDCVHRLKASDLAAQAYQEYMNLTMNHTADDQDPADEDPDQLTAEFQAVMEGIGQDPRLQTLGTWTSGRGNDFLAQFSRATEFLAQNGDTVGNSVKGLERTSVCSDGTHTRQSIIPLTRRQTISFDRRSSLRPRSAFRNQSLVLANGTRIRQLRQIAAGTADDAAAGVDPSHKQTSVGDPEMGMGRVQEAEEPQGDSNEASSNPQGRHIPYQQNARGPRVGFWHPLMSRRSTRERVLDGSSGDSSSWKLEGTPEVDSDEQQEGGALKKPLSCVPSSESDLSASTGTVNQPSPTNVVHTQPLSSSSSRIQISKSALDVSASQPRNQSVTSVSTVGGKFEVTTTIEKPLSTRTLNVKADKPQV